MRAFLFSIVFFFFSSVIVNAQSEWKNMSGENPTNDNAITKLFFYKGKMIGLHEYLGYSVSDDLGETWKTGYGAIPSAIKISNIQFIDTMLYVSSNRKLYVSGDSGATFTEMAIPAEPFNLIRAWDRLIITKTFGSASWKSDTGKTWTDYQPVFGHFVKNGIFWNDTLFTSGSNSNQFVFFYSVDTMKTFVEQRKVNFPVALAVTGAYMNYKGRLLLSSANDYIANQYERRNGKWEIAFTSADFENNAVKLFVREEQLFAESANGLFKYNDDSDSWTRISTWKIESPWKVYSSLYKDGATIISTAIPGYQYEVSAPQVYKSSDGQKFKSVISPLPIRNTRFNFINKDTLWAFTIRDGHHFTVDGGKHWQSSRFSQTAQNMIPFDVALSDTGLYAITRDASSQKSISSQIVEYSRDFKFKRIVQSSTNQTNITKFGGTYFVTKSNELLRSKDSLKTFTSFTPNGFKSQEPVQRGDTILAGNMVSYDAGETFNVLFTSSGFTSNFGSIITTGIVDTSFVSFNESTKDEGSGLFLIKSKSVHPQIAPYSAFNKRQVFQFLTDQTRLFLVTDQAIYFTGNLGQLVEKVAELSPQEINSGAKIQFVNFVENTMFVSRTDGVFSLDVSAYQSHPFVQTLSMVYAEATDSSKTGAFVDIKGRVLTRGNPVSAYAEIIGENIESTKTDIAELDVYPIFRIQGLKPLSFYSARVNAVIGNDTLFGEPMRFTTKSYRFWERSTSDSLQMTFKDATQLSNGKIVAVGNSKVAVSNDLGKTWTGIQDSPRYLNRVVAMKNDILLAGSDYGKFYNSSDQGETWTDVSSPNLVTGGNQTIFKMAYSAKYNLALAVYGEREQATNNASYVLISKDGGKKWESITATRGLPHNRLTRSMAVDGDGNVYLGLNGGEGDTSLYRSTDGAASFKAVLVDTVLGWTVNDIEWSDNYLHVLTDRNIYRSENGTDFEKFGPIYRGRVLVSLSADEYITSYGSDRRNDYFDKEFVSLEKPNNKRVDIIYGFNDKPRLFFLELKKFSRNDTTKIIAMTSDGIWTWRTGQNLEVSIENSDDFVNENKPKEFVLLANYPNPFNPSTTIFYQLPTNVQVDLMVFDVLGRRVATLVNNELQSAGKHEFRFDASRLASGMYLYQLRAGKHFKTGKMMLIK